MLLKINDFQSINSNINLPTTFSVCTEDKKTSLYNYLIDIFEASVCVEVNDHIYKIMTFAIDKSETEQNTEFNIDTDKPSNTLITNKVNLVDICFALARHLSDLYYNELIKGKQYFNCIDNSIIFINNKIQSDDKQLLMKWYMKDREIEKTLYLKQDISFMDKNPFSE